MWSRMFTLSAAIRPASGRRATLLSLAGLVLFAGPLAPQEARPLFDGHTLAGWTVSDFHPSGEVSVGEGVIALARGEPLTGITFAGPFPVSDYAVVVEARRITGSDFFATITFPVGDDFCSLVVGGWGGRVVGLSSLEGSDASENETSRWMSFENERWYTIRLRVADDRISAWIDGVQVVDLSHRGRLLDTRIEVLPSYPFGISAWNTAGEIRRIDLSRLSGVAASP